MEVTPEPLLNSDTLAVLIAASVIFAHDDLEPDLDATVDDSIEEEHKKLNYAVNIASLLWERALAWQSGMTYQELLDAKNASKKDLN